jgi:sporozoite surface protein 2
MSKSKQTTASHIGAGVALGLTVATMAGGTTGVGAEEVTPTEPKVSEVVEPSSEPATGAPTNSNTETTTPKQGDAPINKPGGALETPNEGSQPSVEDSSKPAEKPAETGSETPKAEETPANGSEEKPKSDEKPAETPNPSDAPKEDETPKPSTGSEGTPTETPAPTNPSDGTPTETPSNPTEGEKPKEDAPITGDGSTETPSNPTEGENPKEEQPSTPDNGGAGSSETPSDPTQPSNPSEGDTPSNPSEPSQPSNPTEGEQPTPPADGEKPKEEEPSEKPKVSLDFTVGDKTISATEGEEPKDLEVNEAGKFQGKLNNSDTNKVQYVQVLPDGTEIPVDGDVIPTNSKLVAKYTDKVGVSHDLTVANIVSNKQYSLDLAKTNDGKLSIGSDEKQYVTGDAPTVTYTIKEGDTVLGTVEVKEVEKLGVFDFADKLSEGTHTLTVEGVSKYGIKSVGEFTVEVPKKETPKPEEPTQPSEPSKPSEPEKPAEPETPVQPEKPSEEKPSEEKPSEPAKPETPSEPSKPVEGTKPTPAPLPTPEPEKPVVPAVQPEKPVTPSVDLTVPTAPAPSDNLSPLNPTDIFTPEKPVEVPKVEEPKVEVPKVEAPIVREAPKGISDITVGGNSLYGDQSKNSSVATNGDTTTFTSADSLDLRVSVDTKVVDTSRTEIRLIGRAQGELNSSDFVELHDGTYRLRGIAKDDYYTLYIRTYDSNGKLVSDTTENFSINKNGSSYSIVNEGLEGHSFKSLTSNVQLVESNVDKINSDKTTIKIFRDGKEISVPKGAIKVSRTGGVNGNWEYTYSIDKSYFTEDGVYTLEVFSQTETGVKYSSSSRTIQFIIDNKAPQISITGIRDGGRYKSNEKRITIDVRDISKINYIKAYLNGKEVKVLYDEKTGLYYYDMKSTGQDRNEFVVEVEDEAGNLSTVTVKNFLLSSDLAFSIFNDDNLLYLLGGVGTAVVGFLAFLGFRRKRKLDEEDRLAFEQAELLAASYSSSNGSDQPVTDFVETGNASDRIRVEDLVTVSTQDIPEVEVEDEFSEKPFSTPKESDAIKPSEGIEATTVLAEEEEGLAKTDVLLEDEEELAKTDVLTESEDEVLAKTDVLTEEEELPQTDVLEDEAPAEETTQQKKPKAKKKRNKRK